MQAKFSFCGALAIGLLALSGGGCAAISSVISTGARSAVIVVSNPDGSEAPAPPREQMKALLSDHFLWLADDKRAAQWIAHVEVQPATNPLETGQLTFLGMEKNPAWQPLSVSTPIGNVSQPGFRDLNSWSVNQHSGWSR